jgi:hypothetical protein
MGAQISRFWSAVRTCFGCQGSVAEAEEEVAGPRRPLVDVVGGVAAPPHLFDGGDDEGQLAVGAGHQQQQAMGALDDRYQRLLLNRSIRQYFIERTYFNFCLLLLLRKMSFICAFRNFGMF